MDLPLVPLSTPGAARLVAVGGLDPGGGAGLTQDLRSALRLGATAVLVGTAWTDQSRHGVRAVEPRQPAAVAAALAAALRDGRRTTTAVKVGMMATSGIAGAVARALEDHPGPLVFDPVLAASSGDALFDGGPADVAALVRRADLVTPNLREAAWLAGGREPADLDGMRDAGHALLAAGARAVLVKGGHLAGDAVDLLLTPAGEHVLRAPRVPGPSPRGTGCALATGIAVELARGRPLADAVAVAKTWLAGRIRDARAVGDDWHLGD